jgi:hypothetical protein
MGWFLNWGFALWLFLWVGIATAFSIDEEPKQKTFETAAVGAERHPRPLRRCERLGLFEGEVRTRAAIPFV